MKHLTIAVVVRNDLNRLRSTLASFDGAVEKGVDVLVKDGLSTDGTQEYLEENVGRLFSRYIRASDSSVFDGMNQAAFSSTSSFLWFINAGDLLVTGALENILAWTRNPDADVLAAAVDVTSDSGESLSTSFPMANAKFLRVRDGLATPFPHQGLVVSRRVFMEMGGFDLRFRYCSDFDWMLRLLKSDSVICTTRDVVCRYEVGGLSSTLEAKLELFRIARNHGAPQSAVWRLTYIVLNYLLTKGLVQIVGQKAVRRMKTTFGSRF